MAFPYRGTERLPHTLLWVGVGLALLPFFLLSYFNHPFLDDYYNAANVRTTGLLAQQVELYQKWTGRFSTSLLVTAGNPLVYGSYGAFRLTPALMLLATLSVVYLGLRTLSRALPKAQALLAAAVFLLLYLHMLPDTYQAVYWFTGAIVYHGAGLLLLLVFIAAARAQQATKASVRGAWRLVAAGCTIAAAAANEMTMLHLLLALALLLGVSWHRREWAQLRWWAALLALALVVSLISVAAPGNYLRLKSEGYSKDVSQTYLLQKVLAAVPGTLDIVRHLLGGYRFPFRVGLPLLLGVPVALYWQRRGWLAGTVRLPWQWGALMMGAALVGSCFLFKAIMGDTPPARVINGLLLFLLPLGMVLVWAALAYHAPRVAMPLPAWLTRWGMVVGLVLFSVAGIPRRAWQELLFSAASYDQQQLVREEQMQQATYRGINELVVRPLTGIRPYGVMITDWDLTTDPGHYVNTETALYFNLKSIVVDKNLIHAADPGFHY